MSIYALGDLQGCYDPLIRLLDKINFDPTKDTLWLVGDLVNRGPDSLQCLQFIKSLGDSAITVLGNHDLHLLATSINQKKYDPDDSLAKILEATDRYDLLDWLRYRPLAHFDRAVNFLLIHAGLAPQWDLAMVLKCAEDARQMLQGDAYTEFFTHMYGDLPDRWSADLSGIEYHRFVINCFTRMRYCDEDGKLEFSNKGPIGSQPESLTPWFEIKQRKSKDINIVFGHWSTLTLSKVNTENIYPIDDGCVWGGKLTALKIDANPQRIEIICNG